MGAILTVNSGSSSIKLGLFGESDGHGRRDVRLLGEWNARAGERPPAETLREFLASVPAAGPVQAVVHRVVHGGLRLTRTCRIGAAEEAEIERLAGLAPLHNPPALAWIRVCREVLGEAIPRMAVFDTAFFAEMPEVAVTYALPAGLAREHGLRRYGFHGTAHRALWGRWRELHPELPDGGRAITLQLGAGCSAAAIARGKPLDTTMGFSPLEGLMMATRAGDLDPGLILHLQRSLGWTPEHTEHVLNRESGLLGVSEKSGDMRTLLESDSAGARLAVELFCYRVRKTIGAYWAVLGGIDGIVFGGGIGEHAPAIRERILAPIGWSGLVLNKEANLAAAGKEARLSAGGSAVEAWAIPVNEAEVLAREALALLNAPQGAV